jgi:hypothetical protein
LICKPVTEANLNETLCPTTFRQYDALSSRISTQPRIPAVKTPAVRLLFALVILVILVTHSSAQAPDASRVEQISNWMKPGTYSPTPDIKAREFWNRVGQSPDYDSSVKEAEEISERAFKTLPDDLYLQYSQTGNRTGYQNVFFAKLKAFRTLVVAECIENQGRFLAPIQQAIHSFAEDKTWVLPAHDANNENFEGRRITIDLFASEVACDLANADHLLGDRLDQATRSTIRQECDRRIFEPFNSSVKTGQPSMWWLTCTNNWNAVCLANVTGTALALLDSPSAKAFYVATAEKYIASFLQGFTSDGYCSEGIGYWNYGFGCFIRLGHMLCQVTDGHIDLFENPKARSAGCFARRMEVSEGQYPAFADCTVGSKPNRSLMSYISRRYELNPTAWERTGHSAFRWLDEIGTFSFEFDDQPSQSQAATLDKYDWFKDAGILILRGAVTSTGLPLSVALKGGHNAEHHNHNDIGSFVVCVGDTMPLTDPGAEVYTRRTFSSKRYESGVLNSFGHPVPMVDGTLQVSGRSAAARLVQLDLDKTRTRFELDLSAAYPVDSLKQLTRTFVYDRDAASLTVSDQVVFDAPRAFGTAVITFADWRKTSDHSLIVGTGEKAVSIEIDTGGFPLRIEPTAIEEDVRGGKRPMRIGIDLVDAVANATVRLTIRAAAK